MKEFKPEIRQLDPESLTPYANNAKKHPVHQIDKIAAQIAQFGFDQPIVVDKRMVIIKGHGRREAALRLKLKRVPVIVSDLDEHQAMAARIADNRVAEGEVDDALLKFDLGTLQRNEFDLKLTGFELGELEKIFEPLDKKDGPPGDKKPDDPPGEDLKTQFIVAVSCEDEPSMQEIFEELRSRGFECKLIT